MPILSTQKLVEYITAYFQTLIFKFLYGYMFHSRLVRFIISRAYTDRTIYSGLFILRNIKKINSGALDKKAAQLLGGIGPDVWVLRKGSGIIVDKMTMVHQCGTTVKKGMIV